MPTNIAIRLNVEGGAELKRTMDDAGRSGQQAFQQIGGAADAAGAATDRLTQKVRQAGDAANAGRPSGNAPAPALTSSASTREVERLRLQLDDDARRQMQADRAERIIGAGQSSGAYTEAYASRLRDLAGRKYGPGNDNEPSRQGLSSYDRNFIRYQGFDVASSLGAGASPLTVAFQQGPQVLQQLADREGGLTTGSSSSAATAAGLVTPFTVAAAAVVAATATFGLAAASYSKDQTTLSNSLKLTGRSTEATVSQLDTLARSNAEAGKVSTSTAREIVAAYASTDEIGTGVFDTLIQRTGDYAKLTGQDVPSATAELARMFADPAKGADDLGNKLGGLDDRTRQYIITLAEQGDKTTAQIALSEAFRNQIAANVEQTTRWGQAWNFVSTTADKAWESIKRAAGGAATTPQQALESLNERLRNSEANAPGSEFTRKLRIERDAAQAEADRVKQEAEQRAKTEQAVKDSVRSGTTARSLDPQFARLSEINRQQAELRAGLDNPEARARMDANAIEAAERASAGLKRAKETILDTNGKLITSEELVRRQGELSIEAAKATTAAEKAAVAEKQKRLDLIGKTVSATSAEQQVSVASTVARIGAETKGGRKGDEDKADDYDRASRSLEDRTRRLKEQAETYGMGAEAVERYRAQTELLTAANRAERTLTPELTADIARRADAAADAAKRMEEIREGARRADDFRAVGSNGVRTLVRGLAEGAEKGKILENVIGNIRSRVADLAANSISDLLFGQRGASGTGALGGLLSSLFGGSGGSAASSTNLANAISTGGFNPIPSFDVGGFTGSGGRYDPAGIVHRGEVVFSQDDVSRFGGVDRVEAIRRGGRGYDAGGAVGGYTMPGAAGGAAAGAPGLAVNFIDQRPAGSPDIEPKVSRRPDGSVDVIVRGIEARMGQRAARGQGPFSRPLGVARMIG